MIRGRARESGRRGSRTDGRRRWRLPHCLIAPIPPELPAVETNRPTPFRGAHPTPAPGSGASGEAVTVGAWGRGRRHSPEEPNLRGKNTSVIPLGQTGGALLPHKFALRLMAPADGGASRAHATTCCCRTQPAPLVGGRPVPAGHLAIPLGSGRTTTRGISQRDATPWLTCHATLRLKISQTGSLRAPVRHAALFKACGVTDAQRSGLLLLDSGLGDPPAACGSRAPLMPRPGALPVRGPRP